MKYRVQFLMYVLKTDDPKHPKGLPMVHDAELSFVPFPGLNYFDDGFMSGPVQSVSYLKHEDRFELKCIDDDDVLTEPPFSVRAAVTALESAGWRRGWEETPENIEKMRDWGIDLYD